MINRDYSIVPKSHFQLVRNHLLEHANEESAQYLEHEIQTMANLRKEYFGVVTPVQETRYVPEEIPLTLEDKRKLLAVVPFHEERYVPCRVMWVKVIIRAAYDNALWKNSPDLRLRKYALDARKWLFEPSTLFNSFENICFLFQLPQRALLEWAAGLTRDQVKKFEFLERNGKDPLALPLESQVKAAHGNDR